jgi:hypothetical protein
MWHNTISKDTGGSLASLSVRDYTAPQAYLAPIGFDNLLET